MSWVWVYATCVLDITFMEHSTDVRMFNTMISRKKAKVNFLPKPFECSSELKLNLIVIVYLPFLWLCNISKQLPPQNAQSNII